MSLRDQGTNGLKTLASKAGFRALTELVDRLNDSSHLYTTLRQRPKKPGQMRAVLEAELDRPTAAIAMQGPIWEHDDFTLETLRMYRRRMPRNPIVLCTWADTDEQLLRPIRDLGVEVILAEKPEYPGWCNINMQITGARAAVVRASEMGAEWVMKTRTDQRLYKEGFFSMMIALLEQFPVADGFDQHRRILGVGQGSLKYVPYHMTDQTLFGAMKDMLAFWDIPNKLEPAPEGWPQTNAEAFVQLSVRELMREAAPESRLCSGFLKRAGRKLDWTIVDHWMAVRDQLCFVDTSMVDFFWVKSQTSSRFEGMMGVSIDYGPTTNRKEIGFGEWMQLYTGALPVEAGARFEPTLDRKFLEEVPVSG